MKTSISQCCLRAPYEIDFPPLPFIPLLLTATSCLSSRWCDLASDVDKPDKGVEFDVAFLQESVIQNKNVDSLHWKRAGVKRESPSPGDNVASVPDVKSLTLVDGLSEGVVVLVLGS